MALHATRSVGKLLPHTTALFVCDIQERFRPLITGYPTVVDTAKRTIRGATALGVPCIVTEQYPKALGPTVPELMEVLPPPYTAESPLPSPGATHHKIFTKTLFSMVTPEVEAHMSKALPHVKQVMLLGIEAHVCVLQTALDLISKGYEVHLLVDGVSSQRETDRAIALQRLMQAGALMSSSEMALFQLAGDAKNPHFKPISALAKEERAPHMAQAIVLEHTRTLGTEQVSAVAALGRILAQDVLAPDAVPPFPASIKDGYAVVASDGPGEYTVVGESRAGVVDDIPVRPGAVAYITTGAPVPSGADAVIQVEDTEAVEKSADGKSVKRVRILSQAKAGQDIRPIGSDIQTGAVVLSKGERVGVPEVGILATVGAVEKLEVYKQPHVAVLSTGDEVVEPTTQQLQPGQIRDANRSMLLAAAAQAGCKVTDLGIARDAAGHLEGCLQQAISSGVDVLITSGGVSMGDRDLIKPLLEAAGTVHFGRVLMKPGKPLTFATLELPEGRQMLVFGLPGNPVSSFVCFNLVALPALRRMAGWAQPMLRRVSCRLTSAIKMDPERPEYHRCTLRYSKCPVSIEGVDASAIDWWAVSTGHQISSRLLSARSANALLEIPQASGVLPAGTQVSALLIDDLQLMPTPDEVPATPGF